MSPFIKDGDILTISPFNNGSLGLGQTIAFVHPTNGRLTIHRIIGRSKNRYLLKGDNIFGIDGLVSQEYILGVVSYVERNDKSFTLNLGWVGIIIAFCSRINIFPFILWSWRWGKRFLYRQK
ncbi:MAG: S24/S26 family peptidase [Candidatus Omnitrophota bacterium]